MRLWPFRRKPARNPGQPDEISTKQRLLETKCTKEVFCLLFSKLLQERLPDRIVEFTGESQLRIMMADGKESTLYLNNLWLKYSDGTEDKSELIEKYIRLAGNLNSTEVKAERDTIVAMIKDSEYVAMIKSPDKAVHEHLCADLYIVYGIDTPETIKTLTLEEMTEAGVSHKELRALAVENLKRILPDIEQHGDGPWYLLTAGADYVASLLLFDDLWNGLCSGVEAELVATVPSRDVLLFTGSRSKEGLEGMRKVAAEIQASAPHAISNSLIVRRENVWEPFQST